MVNRKIIGCLILIIVALLCIFIICYEKNSSDSFYIYETEDELIDLFQVNIDDFELYVNKFYGHHLWEDYFDERGHNDFSNYKNFKKYITDDEYKYFEEFDQKYHPAFWSPNGLEFRTKESNIKFIKVMDSDAPIVEVENAQSNGYQIQHYKNGWICIYYRFE